MANGHLLGGRYELGEVIGRGGMSTVHRSYDQRMHRSVAVKVFEPGVDLTDADERYRREVMLLAALRDPGLVTILDADLGGEGGADPAYLVTELVDGPTLSQRVKESPLPEPDVARLGATMSRTLAYVHDHGIVHRDVKPANILLASSADSALGLPKLVDFGIAITADSARLTSADVTLGTANYLSPEQLRGATLTPASDVYSLGLVLIEALTGQPCYPGTGVGAAMARLDHPPVIADSVSPPLRDLLAEMTAADSADRPTAEQAAQRFDAIVPPEIAIAGPLTVATVAGPAASAGARTVVTQRPGRSTMLPDGEDVAPDGPAAHHWWLRGHMLTAIGGLVVVVLLGMGILASFAGRKPPGPPGPSRSAPPPAASTNHARPHRPPAPQARLAPSAPDASTAPVVVPPAQIPTRPPSTTSSSPTPSTSGPSRSTHAPTTPPRTSAPPTTPTSTPPSTPTAPPTTSTPTSPSSSPPTSPPTPSPQSWQALKGGPGGAE